MIWLTWRQFRVSAVLAATALVVVAIVLGVTHGGGTGYLSHDHLVKFISTFLVGMPALIGAFWGAPLVASELESGTYRLAWTQSVTRTRWLAVKVGLIGLVSLAVTGLVSLMLGAWSSATINQDRFSSAMFGQRGVVPIGYAAFGFALGVAAGLLIRRTLPAMATTLLAFMVTRIIVASFVRPHFATAIKISQTLSGENGAPLRDKSPVGAWIMSNNFVDAAGHVVNNIHCGPDAGETCMSQYHQVLTYQPASRYWAFQSYETALFTGLALVLIGLCFWSMRRRVS